MTNYMFDGVHDFLGKKEIRTRMKFLAAGEACIAISWPTPGFKGATTVKPEWDTADIKIKVLSSEIKWRWMKAYTLFCNCRPERSVITFERTPWDGETIKHDQSTYRHDWCTFIFHPAQLHTLSTHTSHIKSTYCKRQGQTHSKHRFPAPSSKFCQV